MVNKILGLTIILSVLLISIISAGVIQPYWDTHPLTMNLGETKTVTFKITNPGDVAVDYEVELKKGQDIASLSKTNYNVPPKTQNTEVPLTITIPSDYDKQVQNIALTFYKAQEGANEGMVGLTTGYEVSFDVVLNDPANQGNSLGLVIALVIALIVILILIIVIVKRK